MINFHSDVMKNVEAYQFVQSINGYARLRIVLKDKNDIYTVKQVKKGVEKKIGSALEIKVETVDKIELSPRGKYRLIVRE